MYEWETNVDQLTTGQKLRLHLVELMIAQGMNHVRIEKEVTALVPLILTAQTSPPPGTPILKV